MNGEEPVLVDFHATWCGPCKAMAPILKDAAKDLAGEVTILKVDIDQNPKLAEKYRIMGVPTFIMFKEGNVLWQRAGFMTKHQLMGMVRENVES